MSTTHPLHIAISRKEVKPLQTSSEFTFRSNPICISTGVNDHIFRYLCRSVSLLSMTTSRIERTSQSSRPRRMAPFTSCLFFWAILRCLDQSELSEVVLLYHGLRVGHLFLVCGGSGRWRWELQLRCMGPWTNVGGAGESNGDGKYIRGWNGIGNTIGRRQMLNMDVWL